MGRRARMAGAMSAVQRSSSRRRRRPLARGERCSEVFVSWHLFHSFPPLKAEARLALRLLMSCSSVRPQIRSRTTSTGRGRSTPTWRERAPSQTRRALSQKNFFGCENYAEVAEVKFISEDIKGECANTPEGKVCRSKVKNSFP